MNLNDFKHSDYEYMI